MDVLCLGICVVDLLAKPVERMPEQGKLELVEEMVLHTGGCASNTAIDMARLGCNAGAMGKIGVDGLGDFLVKRLVENGVDIRGLLRDRVAMTSVTFVMIAPDGERSFFHYIGANAHLSPEEFDASLIAESRILHVAGVNLMPGFDGEPTAKMLRVAKEAGITTSLDTAWDSTGRWLELVEPALPYTDIFLPSIEEARQISGQSRPADVTQFFLDRGVSIVGLKMGKEGCYVRTADEMVELPIYPVKVVDATGAGDAFVAGFLTGVIQGKDLETCARLGNATGAACVTAIGTTAGVQGPDQLEGIMRQ